MALGKTWKLAEHDHGWTWAGHAWVASMVPAMLIAIWDTFLITSLHGRAIAYLVLITFTACFFARREFLDEQEYRRKGTYNVTQRDLTAAVDKTGDSLGPYTAWATAVVYSLVIVYPNAALAMGLVTGIFLVIAMRKSAAKVKREENVT